MERITQDQIKAAIDRAEYLGIGFLESKFKIDWSRTSPDKRHGQFYCWSEDGAFLGQVKNHDRCLELGAAVAEAWGKWFVYSGTWEEQQTAPEVRRKAEWGNSGITFYRSTPTGDEFIGHVAFTCGPQGPIDGTVGSPLRERYSRMCIEWGQLGQLPTEARKYRDQRRPWEGYTD